MAQVDQQLADALIANGIVNPDQISRAEEVCKRNPQVHLGQALVDLGFTTWDDVTEVLGRLLDYEVVDMRSTRIPVEALDTVPKSFAQQHGVIPIFVEDDAITVAITNPYDLYVMDKLRFMLGKDVRCVLAAPDAVDEAIEKFYGVEESTVDNMLQEFTDSEVLPDTSGIDEGDLEEEDDAPMIRLVQLIITEAVKSRTSDIHVEPLQDRLRIRFRIDGKCQEQDSPPKRLQGSIISRIKIMADIDIAEKRRPTDGRIACRVAGKPLDIRVSCLPATHGESVVMRLLEKESILINLEELGFHESDYKRFQSIIKRPNGIFLVTGPTGSGKTTTLYAALNELNRPDKKIITAENPVEYSLSGVNQVEVKERIGLDFARILRSMLRQAPNIILVGEIRDQETAEIAIAAALTGHLVFSTLHTNDAPSAITRLIDMGIKPFLVASSIQAIMAQRLVRRLCEQCKTTYEPDGKALSAVRLRPEDVRNVSFYRGGGLQLLQEHGFSRTNRHFRVDGVEPDHPRDGVPARVSLGHPQTGAPLRDEDPGRGWCPQVTGGYHQARRSHRHYATRGRGQAARLGRLEPPSVLGCFARRLPRYRVWCWRSAAQWHGGMLRFGKLCFVLVPGEVTTSRHRTGAGRFRTIWVRTRSPA